MEKINIMIVDDHTILRIGIRLLLNNQQDMEIVGETGSGREALILAKELLPRVILLDISLDDANGLDIIPELKKIDTEIRVLVLTMHEDESFLLQVLSKGGDGYILKKAADLELITAIRAVNRNEVYIDPSLTKSVLRNIYGKPEKTQKKSREDQQLSGREKEVLKLVAMGYTNRQIADKLLLSIKTIESHKARIKEKLHLSDRSDLVKYAISKGLLQED
ncbi:MAG: response regulator transcription factor [Bacillota bacterium]